MPSHAQQHDIGAFVKGVAALAPEVVTTTSDGTERDGFDIDRDALANRFLSTKLMFPFSATLAAAETVTFAANMQGGLSSTAYTDYDLADGTTGASQVFGSTASTAAQAINDVFAIDVKLDAARRFVRCQITPTLSAAASDTVGIGGVFVMGGSDELPPA